MDLSSTFIWSYVQRLRPYSSTWKQCLDLTQDIVYNKDILGRSSYNLPKTVSHISCFLQGESQVQPPKYKIQTHTHKYNCQSFKSKNPPEINMAIEPNPKPSCLQQQATPLSALVAILVGVLVGLLVRWFLRCRLDHQWICCHDCIGFGLLTARNMLSNDDLLNYHFLNHRWCCLVVILVPSLTLNRA